MVKRIDIVAFAVHLMAKDEKRSLSCERFTEFIRFLKKKLETNDKYLIIMPDTENVLAEIAWENFDFLMDDSNGEYAYIKGELPMETLLKRFPLDDFLLGIIDEYRSHKKILIEPFNELPFEKRQRIGYYTERARAQGMKQALLKLDKHIGSYQKSLITKWVNQIEKALDEEYEEV